MNWLGARDGQISIDPYLGIIMILHVPLKPMSSYVLGTLGLPQNK